MIEEFWERARKFHGHECPGLAIGVKVCEAAIKKMNLSPSIDEELVCISENDACGVDAVQVLMGCTMGKGNLIYKQTGKQAFTFINRDKGQSMRFYLKARNEGMERSEYQEYLLKTPIDKVFDYRSVDIVFPEKARIFSSFPCETCGELAAEHRMRLQEGKKVCLDCFNDYSRDC
ncbi:MAG: formylmethanofuran dehydrogenase [Clostridiales bacterium]|nr:formylmethanofuran dehydrogenase [Clostridiales bacterium]